MTEGRLEVTQAFIDVLRHSNMTLRVLYLWDNGDECYSENDEENHKRRRELYPFGWNGIV